MKTSLTPYRPSADDTTAVTNHQLTKNYRLMTSTIGRGGRVHRCTYYTVRCVFFGQTAHVCREILCARRRYDIWINQRPTRTI